MPAPHLCHVISKEFDLAPAFTLKVAGGKVHQQKYD
jgi:hypothetical protein